MIDKIIEDAVIPIVPICVKSAYTGEEAEYCVYNYNEIPGIFAEGAPGVMRYLVQLHWVLPVWADANSKKKLICRALQAAGLVYPSITDVGDDKDQHYVFETEYCDGEI